MNSYAVLDRVIAEIDTRFQSLKEVASDFGFLAGFNLCKLSDDDLKNHTADLALKYEQDLDIYEPQ